MRLGVRLLVGVVLAWAAVALGEVLVVPTPAGASMVPDSVAVSGVPAVGTLFTLDKNGTLGTHFCTGSVVASPAGDLVLTAAHCVSGLKAGAFAFVPNYDDGKHPYGVWPVTKVVVDQAWTTSENVNDDFAFLFVHQAGNKKTIQDDTGAEQLGIDFPPDKLLKVIGYPDSANAPISCENLMLLFTSTQLQFDCNGYTDGTSGSPLVVGFNSATGVGTVVGVIGGFEQGGYTPSVSYAARFETNMTLLYREVIGL
jgi:V8-like Glu-specific endopeptidase